MASLPLSVNGQSVIDICICYGNSITQYNYPLTTDEDTDLFTGASARGHLPVKFTLVKLTNVYPKEKPLIEKALWDVWSLHLEMEMLTSKTSQDALEMWEFFKKSFREATQFFILSEKVTQHSKPF